MSAKRRVLAGVAVFVILAALEFVIHNVLLKGAYEATAAVWRPMAEMQRMMWALWVVYLAQAAVLPHMYSKGFEPRRSPVGQGVRFGLLVGLLLSSSMSLGSYFSIPIPGSLAVQWFVGGMVEYALVGAAIGAICKPQQGA